MCFDLPFRLNSTNALTLKYKLQINNKKRYKLMYTYSVNKRNN